MGRYLSQALLAAGITRSCVSIDKFYTSGEDYREAFLALIDYCQENKTIAYFPHGNYYISGIIDIEGDITIIGDNVTILSDLSTAGTFINITGSIGTYSTVTETAVRGRNYIKSTLAQSLSPDDLIKIRSDRPFGSVVGYNEDVGRGEMCVVRNVDTTNNIIYLHSMMLDDYDITGWDDAREEPAAATPSNVRVAKVDSARVSIKGITIKNTTENYNTGEAQPTGIKLSYVRDMNIDVSVLNFAQLAVNISHCYDGFLNATIYGAARSSASTGDGSPGYGVNIGGTTMNVRISGTISGCRHAVTHNAEDGVGWNNVISITGYGARSNAVIDCHYPWGSFVADGCELNGGSMTVIEKSLDTEYDVDTGVRSTPYGIQFGARDNIIRNCSFNNVAMCILPRAEADIETLIIDGLQMRRCGTGIAFREGNTISDWKQASISNVIGIRVGIMISYAHGMFSGSHINFNNIECDGTLLYIHDGNRDSADKINFTLRNIKCVRYDWGAAYTNMITYATGAECIGVLSITGVYVKNYTNFFVLAATTEIEKIILNEIDSDTTNLITIAGDSGVNDRVELLSLTNSFIKTTNTRAFDFDEDAQTIKNLIYSNVYAVGTTSITNGTATNNIAGDTIFDN